MKRKKIISIVLIVLGVLGFCLKSQIIQPMIIPGARAPMVLVDFVLYLSPLALLLYYGFNSYNNFAVWAMVIGTIVFILGSVVSIGYKEHFSLQPDDQVWIIVSAVNYVLDGLFLLFFETELEFYQARS